MWQPGDLAYVTNSSGWTIREFIDIAGSILNIFVPLVTIGLAFFGLQVWKKQLRAKTRMEHAIPLMLSALKLREQMISSRSAFITGDEASAAAREIGWKLGDIDDQSERDNVAFGAAHLVRRNRIAAVMRELDSQRLSAEVIFGDEIVPPINAMRSVVQDVLLAYDAYGFGPWIPGILGDLSPQRNAQNRQVIFRSTGRDEMDEIDKRLDEPLNKLRDALKRDIELDA